MNTIYIYGVEYGFCRSTNCNYSDKFNRAVKLANMYEELSDKFDRMIARGQYASEQARLALACKLMMYTGIRIGNEDSAEGYVTKPHPNSKKEPRFVQTYGLTTLLREHIEFRGKKAYLNFLGKKQVENTFTITGLLARQVKKMFDTYEAEKLFDITDYTLTKFIKKYVGKNFTPKDFRTMRANMYAYEMLEELMEREQPTRKSDYNKEVKEVATFVSEHLNNTPGVCKANYIDPMFWDEMREIRFN